MFSKALGTPQPDWPPQTVQTGFCFYDGHEPLDPGITQYLDEGPAPILFTLGSTAVNAAGNFYEESAEAARILGRRALLLAGKNPVKGAFAYAPYSEVFPRAAVIVHQAGVGTTAQALRSGVPSLIVPFNFDQPDNAARVADRGAALVLSQSRYNAKSAAAKLRVLLEDQSIRAKAQSIAQDLLQEDGVAAACAALEPRP
jgi:UDP:flavonoid glycosyltransferase YjiC (YdhE family)